MRPPPSLKRRFVTPEGVDLGLELGTAGARAAAFLLDALAVVLALVAVTVALLLLLAGGARGEALGVLWLVGWFALRNGWFIAWELGGRGATPGKRLLGLRVVARDGARLTGAAVVARNAAREVELFLPLTFLAAQTARGEADALLVTFALGWTGLLLFFPLFNRDRLRLGDVVAGTWVVRDQRAGLGADLAAGAVPGRFSEAALALYGEYELGTLEEVLRGGNPAGLATVAAAIRRKAGLPDEGDDAAFLRAYYAELCVRLERRLALGRRVAGKWERAAPVTR